MNLGAKKILLNIFVSTFLIAVCVNSAQSNIRYHITDLGQGHARGINEIGQVVGQTGFGADGHAILWSDGSAIDIGPVGGGLGATAINSFEQIVGLSDANGMLDGVFLWESGITTPLDIDNTYTDIRFDINDLGQIVGNKRIVEENTSYYHAVKWTDGALTDLGTMDPSNPVGISSHANAINEQGVIAGFSFSSAGESLILRAVIWDDGGIKELGTLGGSSTAYDINELGQVVGESYLDPYETTDWHAVIWENDEITDLGTLDGGAMSVAYAINDDGKIVGRSNQSTYGGFEEFSAVLWENDEIHDLNALVKSNEAWTLLSAYDVNNAGQIVGIGYKNGFEVHAFLLDPFLEVEIDIKPGRDPNYIHINGHGMIPVAILGGEYFDVKEINADSLSFNGLNLKVIDRSEKTMCYYKDVSGDFTDPDGSPDGYLDLVCRFEDDSSRWEDIEADEAVVTGELLDGTKIEGSDTISILP